MEKIKNGIGKRKDLEKNQHFAYASSNMILLAEDDCVKLYSSKFIFSGIYSICEVHYIHSILNGIQLLLSVSLCTFCCDLIGSTICLDAPQWIRNERSFIKGLTPASD